MVLAAMMKLGGIKSTKQTVFYRRSIVTRRSMDERLLRRPACLTSCEWATRKNRASVRAEKRMAKSWPPVSYRNFNSTKHRVPSGDSARIFHTAIEQCKKKSSNKRACKGRHAPADACIIVIVFMEGTFPTASSILSGTPKAYFFD